MGGWRCRGPTRRERRGRPAKRPSCQPPSKATATNTRIRVQRTRLEPGPSVSLGGAGLPCAKRSKFLKARIHMTANNSEPDAIERESERFTRIFVKHKIDHRQSPFDTFDPPLVSRGPGPTLSEAGLSREIRRFVLEAARLSMLHEIAKEVAQDATTKPFPIDDLGRILADVTRAIIEVAQCQPSLAAATVLAHVAGAVQAIADVRTPQGVLLTSASVMPIVESSDGKGIAWKIAMGPFVKYEEELRKAHKKHMQRYKAAVVVWAEEHERIKKRNGFADLQEKIAALAEHEESKPTKPNDPLIVFTGGGTAEGIIKNMGNRPPSVIHSVNDAAQFLRGSAFGENNSVSSGSQLIDLIDSGHTERTIKGDRNEENIRIDGRRLSQCMMIQPDIVLSYTSNTELRRLGLHARHLMTAEESIAHQRVADSLNAIDIAKDERIRAYDEALLEMLRDARFKPVNGVVPHALDAVAVDPIELRLSRDAMIMSDAFVNKITPKTGPGQRYGGEAREAARKIGEHAIRMAGRLHIVDEFTRERPPGRLLVQSEIPHGAMARAIRIAHWFLDEARRYILSLTQIPESNHERLVLNWILRTVEDPDDKRWKPTPAQPDGWYLTKDDRKRGPNEMRFSGKGQTNEREAVWMSMFNAMASAEPPRAYLIGDPRKPGLKVRIPRGAVYS
jgi:Protein of unknown function (DUF3987)